MHPLFFETFWSRALGFVVVLKVISHYFTSISLNFAIEYKKIYFICLYSDIIEFRLSLGGLNQCFSTKNLTKEMYLPTPVR